MRRISRTTIRPPSPAPAIRTERWPRALAAEGGQRPALVDAADERPQADQEHDREQEEQHDHPVGQHHRHRAAVRVTVDRTQHLDRDGGEQHDHDHGLDERLVVALAGEAVAALVDAEQHQHHDAQRHHPPDRVFAQVRVVARRPAVEAQLEGEVVREPDQHSIDSQLREHVSVER